MRVKKISALVLVAAVAGLSLTACGSGDGTSAAADTSASTSASTNANDSAGGERSGSKLSATNQSQTQTTKSDSVCKTDNLAFTAAASGIKNEIVVDIKNNGANTCSMRGFAGVQLVGPDGLGDTGPDAARTDTTGSTVTIASGEETQFLLHYIPDTSGNGKTYTRLSVTPPNETVSEIVDLDGVNITVAPDSGNSPDVFVDPVGYHTGSGK
ncbi:DUF4232 domain-containing protein [Streptomyces kunmingensis]|uniref:DUF4232 domain-containing protein n=1 Tax=Streptomyces kunmingensis TaxID=68225 RepID=A0ABU6C753_9ACTN|nr:DUF4232 domain-containing protein [Streptomyces kunmingensis]MEB3960520.1 DUF4232 domain-containing protein [Streptomyces kunmingensis]